MIRPHKKLVLRAQGSPRLVGLPPDEPESVAAGLASVVSPKPRHAVGRPRKYTDDAAKQRAYNDRRKRKLADAERRDVVAELMKVYRRMQPDIYACTTSPEDTRRANELRQAEHQRRRKVQDEFLTLPLDALREVLGLWNETPDAKGRLHNERSGEGRRISGLSELERILAAQNCKKQGMRSKPAGAAPDKFENDETGDPADAQAHGEAYDPTSLDALLRCQRTDALFTKVTETLFDGEESEPTAEHNPGVQVFEGEEVNQAAEPAKALSCQVCGFRAATWFEARNHVDEELMLDKKQAEHCKGLEILRGTQGALVLHDAEKIRQNNRHAHEIRLALRSVRKEFRNT